MMISKEDWGDNSGVYGAVEKMVLPSSPRHTSLKKAEDRGENDILFRFLFCFGAQAEIVHVFSENG